MDTITLPRTGLPDLTFTGELLFRDSGCEENTVTQGRRHTVSIYRANDGQLVVAVDTMSPFESELSDRFVEAVDDVSEVEAVLSLFEPTERLDPHLFQQNPQQRKQVAAGLMCQFDQQVVNVLQHLEQITAKSNFIE